MPLRAHIKISFDHKVIMISSDICEFIPALTIVSLILIPWLVRLPSLFPKTIEHPPPYSLITPGDISEASI